MSSGLRDVNTDQQSGVRGASGSECDAAVETSGAEIVQPPRELESLKLLSSPLSSESRVERTRHGLLASAGPVGCQAPALRPGVAGDRPVRVLGRWVHLREVGARRVRSAVGSRSHWALLCLRQAPGWNCTSATGTGAASRPPCRSITATWRKYCWTPSTSPDGVAPRAPTATGGWEGAVCACGLPRHRPSPRVASPPLPVLLEPCPPLGSMGSGRWRDSSEAGGLGAAGTHAVPPACPGSGCRVLARLSQKAKVRGPRAEPRSTDPERRPQAGCTGGRVVPGSLPPAELGRRGPGTVGGETWGPGLRGAWLLVAETMLTSRFLRPPPCAPQARLAHRPRRTPPELRNSTRTASARRTALRWAARAVGRSRERCSRGWGGSCLAYSCGGGCPPLGLPLS